MYSSRKSVKCTSAVNHTVTALSLLTTAITTTNTKYFQSRFPGRWIHWFAHILFLQSFQNKPTDDKGNIGMLLQLDV